jgi:TonB family protein
VVLLSFVAFAPGHAQSGPGESLGGPIVRRAATPRPRARIVADSAVLTVASDSGHITVYAETPGGAFLLRGDSATVAAWGATAERLAGPEIGADGSASLNGAVVRAPDDARNVMRLLRLSADSASDYHLTAANLAWEYSVRLRSVHARALFKALREAGGGGDAAADTSRSELAAPTDTVGVTPVAWRKDNRQPRYPLIWNDARMSADVLLQFVVEADGRPRPSSILLLHGTEARYALAARDALLGWRYEPARRNGTPVAQCVQQPFTFSIP